MLDLILRLGAIWLLFNVLVVWCLYRTGPED